MSVGKRVFEKHVAREIGVHASTISREKSGNSSKYGDQRRYNYLEADKKSVERRAKAGSPPRKLKKELESHVKEGLEWFWSPEQIAGMLKNEGFQISHTAIYNYVHKNSLERSFLRRGGRKYKVRTATAGVKFIPDRVDISERPTIVEEKSKIGNWEGDTIISHGNGIKWRKVMKFMEEKRRGERSGESEERAD